MKGDGYYGTVTVFPDGRVYTGQHENSVPENQKLYAKVRRPSIGLAGKINLGTVTPMQNITNALFAKIVNENLSLAAATTIAQSENITHLQLIRLFEAASLVYTTPFKITRVSLIGSVVVTEY